MKYTQIIDNVLKDKRFTDTRVGTNSKYEFSNGNTLPYTGVPFGQNYFAVQTNGSNGSWWFNPHSKTFEGFRITHQPSPWMGDFSNIVVLPFSDSKKNIYNPYYSIFRPNFTQVSYSNGDEALVAPTKYGAFIRFNSKSEAKFMFGGLGLELEKSGNLVKGKVMNLGVSEDKAFTMYIVVMVNKDFELSKDKKMFDIITKDNEAEIKIATSFISIEQAEINLSRMPENIENALEESTKEWEKYFNIFEIHKEREITLYDKYENYNHEDEVGFFYHCVYRSFLFPMTMYEIDDDGNEIHYDTMSKTVKNGKLFTNIGFWDAAKTLFPLYSLVARDIYEDILEGLLNSYRNTGYLPKWLSPDERGLMPGTLVDNVIAEAASKDIALDLMEELLEAMIKSATVDSGNPRYGRAGVDSYNELGYVSSDHHESVNQTLDNSLSDYSISVVASKLGNRFLADEYIEKSKNYKNLYDSRTGFLWKKNSDGVFEEGFDPLVWGSPYTEGSAYQNSYNMYHDIDDFIDIYGGKKKFEERLDEISNSKTEFKEGVYKAVIHEMKEYEQAHFGHIAISNQPSFHLPYLYNHVNKPHKTQLILKEFFLNYFNLNYDGYPGDEDNGSLSAWYILSTLGIYPLCPGSNEYELGIAFYDKASIRLFNGHTLEIEVDENYHHKKFVDSLEIDGSKYEKTSIDYEKLINTNKIKYTLGIVPRG